MARFTKEERALIHSVLNAYYEFSKDSYTQIWHNKMERRLSDDKLSPKDLQYIYSYAENLAAQTVRILMDGPEDLKPDCKIINEKLVALLLKLKSMENYPDKSPLS